KTQLKLTHEFISPEDPEEHLKKLANLALYSMKVEPVLDGGFYCKDCKMNFDNWTGEKFKNHVNEEYPMIKSKIPISLDTHFLNNPMQLFTCYFSMEIKKNFEKFRKHVNKVYKLSITGSFVKNSTPCLNSESRNQFLCTYCNKYFEDKAKKHFRKDHKINSIPFYINSLPPVKPVIDRIETITVGGC
ncbi:4339_t:CDS:1, partial [Dentiscutata heterogama]